MPTLDTEPKLLTSGTGTPPNEGPRVIADAEFPDDNHEPFHANQETPQTDIDKEFAGIVDQDRIDTKFNGIITGIADTALEGIAAAPDSFEGITAHLEDVDQIGDKIIAATTALANKEYPASPTLKDVDTHGDVIIAQTNNADDDHSYTPDLHTTN